MSLLLSKYGKEETYHRILDKKLAKQHSTLIVSAHEHVPQSGHHTAQTPFFIVTTNRVAQIASSVVKQFSVRWSTASTIVVTPKRGVIIPKIVAVAC